MYSASCKILTMRTIVALALFLVMLAVAVDHIEAESEHYNYQIRQVLFSMFLKLMQHNAFHGFVTDLQSMDLVRSLCFDITMSLRLIVVKCSPMAAAMVT